MVEDDRGRQRTTEAEGRRQGMTGDGGEQWGTVGDSGGRDNILRPRAGPGRPDCTVANTASVFTSHFLALLTWHSRLSESHRPAFGGDSKVNSGDKSSLTVL